MKQQTKTRRTVSESSSSTYVAPLTPITPHHNSHSQQRFDFDDVFELEATSTPSADTSMNFEEMSNCLITLMDHSSLNGDNVVVTSGNSRLESIGNGYEPCDNNYDSAINYNEQQSLNISQYFT